MARTGTPIEPGLIDRVVAGVRFIVTGRGSNWFGPQQPMTPVAQEEAHGRVFDYPMGYNLRFTPRQEELVTFAQMRALADSYDILRLIIETRKDQICKFPIEFVNRDDAVDLPEDLVHELHEFFAFPDKEHDWQTWLRMVLEELFVTDAVTLFPRLTNGGDLYALEQIDGTTIKRVLDPQGRTPLPPEPAYQQILKGLPAVDYSRDELIYRPRNPRVWKVYGMSCVEQVIMTVNIALKRQLHTLSYYTEGTVPEALASVPKEWTTEQIRQFQLQFDLLISGQPEQKRKMIFIPDGVNYIPTKDAILKDEMDDYLARIICFAFSISPQAFTRAMNRASADTGKEIAIEEGLIPTQAWLCGMIDYILAKYLGHPEARARFKMEQKADPLAQAQIDNYYVVNGTLTRNEVRSRLAYAPLTPEQLEEAAQQARATAPASPVTPGTDTETDAAGENAARPKLPAGPKERAQNEAATAGSDKVFTYTRDVADEPGLKKKERPTEGADDVLASTEKAATRRRIDRNRPAIRALRDQIESVTYDYLQELLREAQGELVRDSARVRYAKRMAALLGDIAKNGRREAELQLVISNNPDITEAANEAAIEWADEHAASMVGMKWVDDELVENPNPKWQISDETRDAIARNQRLAQENGWSVPKQSKMLQEDFAFSKSRADMIARTETHIADLAGNRAQYEKSGVVWGWEWLIASVHDQDDECDQNDGVQVPLGALFPSGDEQPPAHPNCFVSGTLVAAHGVSAHYKRRFSGEVVVIRAAGIDDLAVTPNHPILTRRGWVAAGALQIGDELAQARDYRAVIAADHPQDDYIEAPIEQIADALRMAGGVSTVTVPTTTEAFHGDGVADGKVEIVRPDRALGREQDTVVRERIGNSSLGPRHVAADTFDVAGAQLLLAVGHDTTTRRVMRRANDVIAFARRFTTPPVNVSVGHLAQGEPQASPILAQCGTVASERASEVDTRFSGDVTAMQFAQSRVRQFDSAVGGSLTAERKADARPFAYQGRAADPDDPREILKRFAGHIAFVKVDELLRRDFDGSHVYNLETTDGWYLANTIIAHNCLCDCIPITFEDAPDVANDDIEDAARASSLAKYDDNQPRDDAGRWTSGGETYERKDGVWHTANGPADDATAARLNAMGIPPAWTNVRLNPDPRADLQVIGRDAKGRPQYLYSAAHSERAAAEKFERGRQFNAVAPKIEAAAFKDMVNEKLPQATRDAAAITALIAQTGFRVGSERDTGADAQAYGASTLRGEHVSVSGDTIRFEFPGKSGVAQAHELQNARLAQYIGARQAAVGDGKLFTATDAGVRSYFKSKAGDVFKVKDFRTRMATQLALQAVEKLPKPTTKREYQRSRVAVGTAVASRLGNTPSMALNSYIPPAVFARWGFR